MMPTAAYDQLTNTTDLADVEADEANTIVILVVVSLFILTGTSGTIVVIVTILRSPRIRRQQGFIVSLAFADLIFLSVIMPFVAASIANDYAWVLGDVACEVVGYLAATCVQASSANICLIAFNRYFSIVFLHHYKRVFTKRNMILMAAAAWLYGACIGLPSFFGFGRFIYLDYIDICMYDWNFSLGHRIYIGMANFLIPFSLIGYFYIHIFVTVKRSKQKVRRRQGKTAAGNTGGGGGGGGISREEIRLTVQLAFIVSWFVICWGPFLTLALIVDPAGDLERVVYDITVNLLVLNSVLNPFVYFFSNRTLRQAVRGMMCCRNRALVQVGNSTAAAAADNRSTLHATD